ncbi:MAG: sigma factor, partial [Peptococcaceae bacterium]|jgi:RNA polymerase sigma factor|nr:sigma factor [Peptococcaceae bacterium]
VDRFDPGRGIPFLAFARLVIRSRLNDHLRREGKKPLLESVVTSEDGQELENPALTAQARERYLADNEAAERAGEIAEFGKLLAEYGLSFDELVQVSPSHRDTRRTLQQCARVLAGRPELMTALKERGRLPIGDLQKATGVHMKTLERGRKYIIAMAFLLDGREEFIYLYEYVKGIWEGGGDHGAGNRGRS